MWRFFAQPHVVEAPDDAGRAELGNVFEWAKSRRAWLHLTGFLLFSTLIHGSGFYLFQVVYPSPLRVEPEVDSIAMLDTSDPDVRALLQRISDRSVYLFPPSVDSGVRMQLREARVRFTPSFQKEDLQPLSPGFEWSLPPQLEAIPHLTSPGEVESRVSVVRKGALINRKIAPWSIMQDYLNRAEWLPELELSLKVDQEGLVSVSGIKGDLKEEDREELKQVIESTLRFLPAGEVTVGEVAIGSKHTEIESSVSPPTVE